MTSSILFICNVIFEPKLNPKNIYILNLTFFNFIYESLKQFYFLINNESSEIKIGLLNK